MWPITGFFITVLRLLEPVGILTRMDSAQIVDLNHYQSLVLLKIMVFAVSHTGVALVGTVDYGVNVKPFVKVVWHDASDEKRTWVTEDELNENTVVVDSYGFLLKKTRTYVHLAADYSEGDETGADTYGRVCKIPRKMIKSISSVDLLPRTPSATLLPPASPDSAKPDA